MEYWLCDGANDCGNNRDEDPETCRTNGQSLSTAIRKAQLCRPL